MATVAQRALEQLWARADRAQVRSAALRPRLHMTASGFQDYLAFPTAAEKEAFHAEVGVAERAGAVKIEWERRAGPGGAIKYIELGSFEALGKFLNKTATTDRLVAARDRLLPWVGSHLNVERLLAAWESMKSPRGIGVDCAEDVADVCRLVEECRIRDYADVSQRRVSTQLFGDSKRIEQLGTVIDLITAPGFDQDEARQREAVFASLGLLHHPQPVLIAGAVTVLSGRNGEPSASVPAFPYSGFAPHFLHGGKGAPAYILTVENLTTFNEIAAEMAGPVKGAVLYTGGYASPSMLSAYVRLVTSFPETIPVFHWGDTDLHGFRIARQLAESLRPSGRSLQLWMMGKYVDGKGLTPLAVRDKSLISAICHECGWLAVAEEVARIGESVEQEFQPLSTPSDQYNKERSQ